MVVYWFYILLHIDLLRHALTPNPSRDLQAQQRLHRLGLFRQLRTLLDNNGMVSLH